MEERERILEEFECLKLAPNDDAYLRILVKDTLECLRTGKRAGERQSQRTKRRLTGE